MPGTCRVPQLGSARLLCQVRRGEVPLTKLCPPPVLCQDIPVLQGVLPHMWQPWIAATLLALHHREQWRHEHQHLRLLACR